MNWLVSYPKSGNTWARILFVLAREGSSTDINKIVSQLTDYSPWEADRKWFEPHLAMPWKAVSSPQDLLRIRTKAQADMLKTCGPHAIIKSHNIVETIQGVSLFPQGANFRAVHIVRNPLDVAVSMRHHVDAAEDLVQRVMLGEHYVARRTAFCAWEKYGSWRRHTESWLERAPYPVFHMRYEDLVAGRADVLAAALAHAGLKSDETAAALLLERTTIGALREAENTSGFTEIPSKLKNFFRQGKPGAWKEDLSAEARKAIVADCKPLMDHFGFEY